MARIDPIRDDAVVLDPTESRQGSPRKMNLRVLIFSLAIAAAAGIVLVSAFWRSTPTTMDYSSGGKLGESTGTSAPAAPDAAKPATQPPTTP